MLFHIRWLAATVAALAIALRYNALPFLPSMAGAAPAIAGSAPTAALTIGSAAGRAFRSIGGAAMITHT